ncbi:glycosyltransferase family 39 protein [Phormidium sp. FACHB-1136]|uniref:ArnT family glycosyltransferase n=1 Tax=Phormidium sp. FACHB-1136 TaxID=2692848 RepID=UPI001687A7FA|nr:glycosyltransferase family 39 protein [Phormidium sp. FACHB-1136]MBD2426256.1 glycosyltransferase family 39 protein [Phormidium sp. FACHB-1136]
MKDTDQGQRGLLWLLVGGLIYRTIVAIWLLPGFDEAYYYLYSRHLNWSYFDHPVMVALTTGLGWWTTGIISPLTIRVGALLLYGISLGLLYLAARRMHNPAVGQMTMAFGTLVPLIVISFGILTSPDNGLMLFWSATLLVALWEFFPTRRRLNHYGVIGNAYIPTWRVALLGGLVGLACISKYHGFVLGLGLVGFCLSRKPYRKVFQSPWLVAAAGCFAITLFPLLYWNAQHDWISFRFHLGMRFDGGTDEPSPFRVGQMIGYWLLSNVYLFPLFGLPLWWVTLRQTGQQVMMSFTPSWDTQEAQGRDQLALVLWLSLPIVLLFTVLGGKQQIFPAWPAPGYWGLLILLGAQAVLWQRRRPRLLQRWLWGSGAFLAILSVIALLHLQLGFLQQPSRYAPFGGLIPVEQDGSTELIDTLQLRRLIAEDPPLQAILPEVGFIFTNEYYLGGYFDMAIHPLRDVPVTVFSQDPRGFAFWFNQTDWLGQDALYMTLDRFAENPDILGQYQPLFDTIEPLTTLDLRRGGEVTETIHLFRASGFNQPYGYPYHSKS